MRYERVKVKRDLQTVHNKEFAPWEIPILEFIFDEGNVERLGEFVQVDREYPAASAEFNRLASVYGSDPKSGVPHVASVYGNAGAGVRMLRKEIEAAQADDEEDSEKSVVEKAPAPVPTKRRSRSAAQIADSLLS